jgi:hypothetical protein
MTRRREILTDLHDLTSAVRDLAAQVDRLGRSTEKMETILLVREPTSPAAAEAYEGLRRQVLVSRTERTAHLNQLVQFDAAMRGGAGGEVLASMVDGWVTAAGLDRCFEPDRSAPERFVVLADGGGPPQVIDPAYIDSNSSQILRQGTVRYLDAPSPAVADDSGEAEPAQSSAVEGDGTADGDPGDPIETTDQGGPAQ